MHALTVILIHSMNSTALQQAKQLLDRVERRELYKCVGRYFSPQKLRGPKVILFMCIIII